jgi:hypothetical protein
MGCYNACVPHVQSRAWPNKLMLLCEFATVDYCHRTLETNEMMVFQINHGLPMLILCSVFSKTHSLSLHPPHIDLFFGVSFPMPGKNWQQRRILNICRWHLPPFALSPPRRTLHIHNIEVISHSLVIKGDEVLYSPTSMSCVCANLGILGRLPGPLT